MKAVPMDQGLALLDENLSRAEATGSFDAYPEMKRLMPLLRPLFKLDPARPFPFTLTHGDLRSDNIIAPTPAGGRLAIIDWQLAGVGDPAYDVVRWLVQSISIEDRRETEQELLQHYHARLVERGVRNYRYKKFLSIDRSSERAQDLFHQFYARLDAALVDWEVEKLLRVLPYIYPFIKVGIRLRKLLGRPG
jgi:thiamine kinase-like enzyme